MGNTPTAPEAAVSNKDFLIRKETTEYLSRLMSALEDCKHTIEHTQQVVMDSQEVLRRSDELLRRISIWQRPPISPLTTIIAKMEESTCK